ncbi:hypothetical protein DMUE_4919, partial [Dictyocoela muelleri]
RKLNLTVNTNTNYAPYEIYYKSSIFRNFGRKINIDKEDIVKRASKKNEKYQMRQKNSRIRVNYKYGDKVYVKSFSQDKLNPKWKGPFEIIEKSKNGNNLYVDAFNKKLRVSIKNCRPHKKGEDVMPCNSITKNVCAKEQALELKSDKNSKDDRCQEIDEKHINSNDFSTPCTTREQGEIFHSNQ